MLASVVVVEQVVVPNLKEIMGEKTQGPGALVSSAGYRPSRRGCSSSRDLRDGEE
jgi:hypothetical protein